MLVWLAIPARRLGFLRMDLFIGVRTVTREGRRQAELDVVVVRELSCIEWEACLRKEPGVCFVSLSREQYVKMI